MREPSLRQRRAISLGFLGVIVLALAAWALTYTPMFRADRIRVVGVASLRPEDVRRIAGIDGSTNVVHIDTDAVVDKLTADPWIASASVDRELPSTLVLRIVERDPVALVVAAGPGTILASDGTLLPPAAGRPDLPTMHAAVGTPDEAQRLAAAELLGALDPVVMQRLREITVGQDDAVTLTLRGDIAVDAGVPGEEAAKAAALRAILRWAAVGERALASIDVSAPDAPSVRLRDGSSVTP